MVKFDPFSNHSLVIIPNRVLNLPEEFCDTTSNVKRSVIASQGPVLLLRIANVVNPTPNLNVWELNEDDKSISRVNGG